MENNQVNRYRGVWKIISLIIAVFLIIPMFCACDFGQDKTDDTNENIAVISDGMIVGESQGSGAVTLTSNVIPVSEYADYGVSPLAVTAITVTATVSPVNATIKELNWSLAWDQEAEDSNGDCFYTDNYF